ncbi:ankyrin repeat and IBR domain-containing protein 1-like [Dysidea avara]|uniref:ankyrin repeat and IBR domain-containing protein 1-like n=1 Tax=Dysidea avara TaxID=196820 RepID=UPI00332CAAB4
MGGVDSKLTEYLIEGREKEALELYHSNESFNDQINPNARLSKSPGDTPLLCAARYGMKSLLEELLTSGGNPCVANRKNETAFHLVCKFSQSITSSRKSRIRTALLTRLLEHVGCGYQTVAAAAQPNKCTRKDGKSLYYIFLSAQDESLNTPLHLACASGLLECVELLVAYDAPLFVTNVAGQTPCDVAAGAKHVVIAKLLESKMVFAVSNILHPLT